jgi:hypothetical protein
MPLTTLGSIRQERVMDLDELRDDIWGYLFEHKASKSIDEIAAIANRDAATIRSAVSHEWFAVSNDQVSIAYATPGVR